MVILVNGKKKLSLSKKNKLIAGVCSGLGEYFDVDPVFVRIMWIVLFFVLFRAWHVLIIVYIISWAILPDEQEL